MTQNNLFKVLLQKVFEIKTRSSPASLTVVSHEIPHAVEDSWPVDPFLFSRLLSIITRKKGIPNVTFLSDSKSCFHSYYFLEICLSGSKTPNKNVIEILVKFQKRPL